MILGIDAALNHTGLVFLGNSGEYIKHYVIRVEKKPKGYNSDCYSLDRLNFNISEFKGVLYKNEIEYAIIEDYSFTSKSASLYEIGAWAESIKLLLYKRGIPFRLVSPKSCKLFATGKGDAEKEEMINSTIKVGCPNFRLAFPSKITKDELKIVEDLHDAFALGRLLYTELQLRSGNILLKNLPKEQIMVFNKVSSSRPDNILSIDFIERG